MSKPTNDKPFDDELFFASLDWEKEWRRSLPRLSDRELLEVFPVSKETLQEKLVEWRRRRDIVALSIKSAWQKVPREYEWFFKILFEKYYLPELREIDRQIARIKRLLAILSSPTDKQGRRWQSMADLIAEARVYPIYEFARDKLDLKPSGKNFFALCPFHNEKTPSFYLFTESNRFYCFGCHEKGDVINLATRLCGVGFAEAVRMLK